ncbi:MAG TPA: glycosyltransferase [Thermodesulfovibrionales bacterium]|nr:glycosyltransferase [Thermodesulfovibrionales bacterium]
MNDWLLMSLKAQTVVHEMIIIDTAEKGFQSAAQALNFGGSQAKGTYIMFIHQDVNILSNTWLEDAERMLDTIPNLGIAGVVGSVEEGDSISERMRNVIAHGDDKEQIGNAIPLPEPVQTLDELLLIIPRKIFREHQFDEHTCTGWHLYGTDYCLNMLTIGKGVYVIPLYVIHKSKGGASTNRLSFIFNFGLSGEYYHTLEKILDKHKDHFMWVYTTPGYGKWKTTESLFTQRVKYAVIEMIKWSVMAIGAFLKGK